MRLHPLALSATALLALLPLTACTVSSNKNNGGDNVRINTPFGGMHVESNQTSAADIGLPAYPGATVYQDKDSHSANVNMSFGSFHLKVQAADYQTTDSGDKVLAFYRKALAQYGDVLECDHNKPVGQPAVASSGLTCSDDEHGNASVHAHTNIGAMNINHDGHELRAGSPHAFRVVSLDADHPGKFALVYLELPRGEKDTTN
jgi:hypothetical protein